MTITENLGALGSWTVKLAANTPRGVLSQLGYFGHLAVFRGTVDVSATADATLLRGARYVGVLREKAQGGRSLSGAGMLLWLGDEDHKGAVLENPVNLTNASLATCLAAILPPAVTAGSVLDGVGTYTGSHQWQTPRDALDVITTAFGVEYRVNGDGTVDTGHDTTLYVGTPTCIVSATGSGTDLNVTTLGGDLEPDITVVDYSTRVVLLGQTTTGSTSTPFAEATADAASVPYKDVHGNTVTMTRMVSDSSQTTGSVAAAAQLQLNRFARPTQVLSVTAEDYEIAGTFAVGDYVWLYDPDNGLVDSTQELTFGGEVIHPARIRVSGLTWPVTYGHTVAFRTQDGVWIDLTRYVSWETGTTQLTVGDLPPTLTSGSNPVGTRADGAPDTTVPQPPTGVTLATAPVLDAKGKPTATITVSWSAPSLNVDGSVVTDLSYYRVQYRLHATTVWSEMTTAATTITLGSLGNGLQYDVQVLAVDTTAHVSAASTLASIVTAADSTPLNAPSDPTVGSYLGQLRITWDGKDNTGALYPGKFSIVEVHVSATTGFTPSTATLVSQLAAAGSAFATAPYGSTRFVKLVTVDNSGNRSASSGQVSGATVQVADGDIATLSVGKLIAGTISVDVLLGGRLTTGLTGARVEVNSSGVQGFQADGVTKWLSLTNTESLLTGTFKTALSGRRIEIGASGVTGELALYSTSGVKSRLAAITVGSAEALVMGIPVAGGTGTNYNHVEVDSTEVISMFGKNLTLLCGAYGRTGPGGFQVVWSDDKLVSSDILRLSVDNGGTNLLSPNGTGTFVVNDTTAQITTGVVYTQYTANGQLTTIGGHGAVGVVDQGALTTYSPKLQFNTMDGFAMAWRGNHDPTYGLVIEAEDWSQSQYIYVRAIGFLTVSEASTKAEIAPYSEDALAAIVGTPVRTYRRLEAHAPYAGEDAPVPALVPSDRVEVGLLRHEAPEQIQAGQSIDLYQMAALEWRAIQQLAARMDALERHK